MKKFSPAVLRIAPFLALASLTACGAGSVIEKAGGLAQRMTEPVGCDNAMVRDQLWKSLYDEAALTSDLPPPSLLRESLDGVSTPKSVSARAAPELVDAYSGLYSEIYTAAIIASNEQGKTPEDRRQILLKNLAELELGDRTTPEKSAIQDRLEARFGRLSSVNESKNVRALNAATCTSPDTDTSGPDGTPVVDVTTDPVPLFEEFRGKYAAAVYGAYKIMSVGYQSCSALNIDAMNAKSPSVKGISIVGTHPAGGKQRIVTSATNVMKTNQYYSTRVSPSGASTCLPQQKNPLIYDFGGKPYVSSVNSMEFDLFKNGGSGTIALGIDCSGYVSGALLVSGLKLKKEASAKAYQVGGVSSSMLMNPEGNGLSCLARQKSVTPGTTLRGGDIIVQSGHVVMIDQVGTDPFGIAKITKAADCTASKIPSSKFNFTITQSSPSLTGVGLNRFKISDYVASNSAMRNGLVQYAIGHCKAKFGATTTLPSSVTAAIVRHKGTTDCFDKKVSVKYSSCMNSCKTMNRTLASE